MKRTSRPRRLSPRPQRGARAISAFSCPGCGELRATVHPRNNLAHYFSCQKNLNNIDLLITLGRDFLSAVALLEAWLEVYQAQQDRLAKPKPPTRG